MKSLRFLREPLLICAGIISVMIFSGITDALFCFMAAIVFCIIFFLFRRCSFKKTDRLIKKLLPEKELSPGDTIILNPTEILPADSVLLDSRANFVPVLSTPGTSPAEFLQGDEVPSGYRLISDEPVNLHVSTHYDDSTFTKFIHAFKSNSNKAADNLSALFYDKLQLYSFQKGVLISDNLKKLAKTKAFFINKSAVIKTDEYSITDICPAKSKLGKEKLLLYAAQAEIPYAHTSIGNVLIRECNSEVLLSEVEHTEKHQGLGIITKYKKDTICAGCREFLITSGIGKLPDFEDIESNSAVNETFVYIALNNNYIGYITLSAPLKSSYNDFLNYITGKKLFMKVVSNNSSNEADLLVNTRSRLQKKCRTSFVAYIDSQPTDVTLRRLSDYNIFIGSGSYCPENDFDGVTIIPSSFKSLLRTIHLSKKVCFTTGLYTVLLPLIKTGLIAAGFIIPGIQIWYAVLAAGIINTALIKVYDLFFRLFTRRN